MSAFCGSAWIAKRKYDVDQNILINYIKWFVFVRISKLKPKHRKLYQEVTH